MTWLKLCVVFLSSFRQVLGKYLKISHDHFISFTRHLFDERFIISAFIMFIYTGGITYTILDQAAGCGSWPNFK
jgi:hypothetical protein